MKESGGIYTKVIRERISIFDKMNIDKCRLLNLTP